MLIVLGCAVLVVALYTLALYGTAGTAALGAVAVTLAVAIVIGIDGGSVRGGAGFGTLTAGGSAVVWSLGRSHRRRRAGRSALAAYRAASAAVPRLAATVERDRIAAELHDVAAHRLTGIAVASAAALRLADPALTSEATAHAAEAGRLAVAELDRLASLDRRGESATLADIDTLVGGHPGVAYHRAVASVPPEAAALAFRVVRESLTNAMRYATGAAVHVRIESPAGAGRLVVTVTDDGAPAAVDGLGSGTGLASLDRAVRALGGTLTAGAGPPGFGTTDTGTTDAGTAGGWTVRAVLPLPSPPGETALPVPRSFSLTTLYGMARRGDHPRRATEGWRGAAALDWALVVLAVALPAGMGLLYTDVPPPFKATASGMLLLVLLILHAVPLRWRRLAPKPSLAAAQGVLLVWLACDAAGLTAPHSAQLVLECWWVELTLLYTVGAYGSRGWPAPIVVAGLGAFPLVEGLTGPPIAVWATLTAAFAVPTGMAWGAGVLVGRRRRRRRDAAALDRDRLDLEAAEAARAERGRIAAGLRRTAGARAEAVVRAAEDRRLDLVLTEAKAGLGALRELLDELRGAPEGDPADDTPPPVVAGIAALATRRRAVVRYAGARRPLPAAVEVAAYRVAEALLADGETVTVTYLEDGLALSGPRGARRVRAMADAAGGTVAETDDRVRVWLPEVFPA
ncbi:ATP-binding protein [Streptosporangium sp. NPDC051023]|uniref:ATP-binding protein n=1 Tax=Streptosporangium sp. NPDC051023 TaxID=3155410 RepID=UPI003450FDE6